MKTKIIEILLICLIVLMVGGILSSAKGGNNQDVTEIVSEFEEISEYDTSGYIDNPQFEEDNVNIIGKINGKIGDGISSGVNKTINWFFEMVKKLVS